MTPTGRKCSECVKPAVTQDGRDLCIGCLRKAIARDVPIPYTPVRGADHKQETWRDPSAAMENGIRALEGD